MVNDIIMQHRSEAEQLALEHYNLTKRLAEIDDRMSQLAVIIQTAEHMQKDKEGKPDE